MEQVDILQQDANSRDREAQLQQAALPRRAYGDVAARIAEMESLNDPPNEIADEIERAVREHGNKVHPDQFGLMANDLLRVADDYRAGDVATARRRMTAILRDNNIKMGPKPNARVRFDPRIHGKPKGMDLQPGDQVDVVLPEVVWEPRGHEPRVLAKAAVIPADQPKAMRDQSRERRARLENPSTPGRFGEAVNKATPGTSAKVDNVEGGTPPKKRIQPLEDSAAVRGMIRHAEARKKLREKHEAAQRREAAAKVAPKAAAPAGQQDVVDRIREATARLAKEPGGFVNLADLRDELADVPRKDLDAALRVMARGDFKGVRIFPQADRANLKERDHAAALKVGGEDNNLIALEPSKAATPKPPAPPVVKKAAPAKKVGGRKIGTQEPNTNLDNQRILDLRRIAKDEHVRVPLGAKKEEIRQLILAKRGNKAAGIGTPPIKRVRPPKPAAKPDTELRNQRIEDLRKIAKDEGIRIPAKLRTKDAIRQHILNERKAKGGSSLKSPTPAPAKAVAPVKAIGKAAVPAPKSIPVPPKVAKAVGAPAKPAPRKPAPRKKLPGVMVRPRPAKQIIAEGGVSEFRQILEDHFKAGKSRDEMKAMLERVQNPILRELAKKWGVHVPAGDAKPFIINKILDAKFKARQHGGGTRFHGANLRGLRQLAKDEKIRIPSWMKQEDQIRQFIKDVRAARGQAASQQAQSLMNMPAGDIFPTKAQQYHVDVSHMQELVKHVEQPYAKERSLAGGAIGDTRLRETRDGYKYVWKRDRKNTSDGEQISNHLAKLMGLGAPDLYRNEDTAVTMEFVPGGVAGDLLGAIDFGRGKGPWAKYKSSDEVFETDDAKRIALLDALVMNTDRHTGNWMLGDNGRLIPIDHGFVFGMAFGRNPEKKITASVDTEAKARDYAKDFISNTYRDLRFRNILFDSNRNLRDNDFTQADMAHLRQQITAMLPMMTKLGKEDLVENMLARLEIFARHAKGKRNIIAK